MTKKDKEKIKKNNSKSEIWNYDLRRKVNLCTGTFNLFLAHLWCAYAMALCLSWFVRREVGCVCVEHNYPKMWMD